MVLSTYTFSGHGPLHGRHDHRLRQEGSRPLLRRQRRLKVNLGRLMYVATVRVLWINHSLINDTVKLTYEENLLYCVSLIRMAIVNVGIDRYAQIEACRQDAFILW